MGRFTASLDSGGRLSKYLRGLTTSYGALGVAFLFTAITVPLGITTLGLEGWGIWVFCQQASAVICLFENFTQSAFVRLLVEVKDDPTSLGYKKMVKMGQWCFGAQGLILLTIHVVFIALVPFCFPNLSPISGWMILGVLGLTALINQAGKVNGQLLYAHQHQDLAAFAVTLGLLVNLLLVVTFLPLHPQAQTMAWAFFCGSLTTQILYAFFAFRAGCRPTWPGTPRIGWPDFKPLWFLGRRFFLYSFLDNLGSNLPTLLAGRFLSLEMLGVWGVLQRIANMMSQVVQKIPQLAAPALMEMHFRGEEIRFRRRSGQVLLIQNCFGGALLGALSLGGEFFLQVWLGQPIPMNRWVLPIFTLGLLADFDQRIRFSLDAIRLQLWRPTLAAVFKVFLILFLVPWMSHLYGLIGMTLALAIISGFILTPLSLAGFLFKSSYCLSPWETVAGLAAYLITAGVVGLVIC